MKNRFVFLLALKNLRKHRMRTFLTVGGVAISVCFISFLLSLGFGLQRMSTSQIAQAEDLQMLDVTTGKSRLVSINDDVIAQISQFTAVGSAYPEISVASEVSFGQSLVESVVYGKNADLVALERPKVSEGKVYAKGALGEVLVNKALANKIGFKDERQAVGKQVKFKMVIRPELLAEKGTQPIIEEKSFLVVGVIDEGSVPYAYVPLDGFKKSGVDKYSSLRVKLKDKVSVDKTKVELEHMGYKVTSIKETIDQVNNFFGIFRIILLVFGSIAVVVACLGMFNTLTISLVEKTREVGIMKVLGTTRKDIRRIFIAEAMVIGLIGGMIGLVSNYLIASGLNIGVVMLAKNTGNTPVEIFYFPLWLVAISLLASTVVSYATGIAPAKRASKISALDALRYE